MATECFQQFLKSLSTTALDGFINFLQVVLVELQVEKVKALARQLKISNLVGGAKKGVSTLGTAALNEIKGALKTYDLTEFLDCPTVNSVNKISVDTISKNKGSSDSAAYNTATLEMMQKELDNSVSKVESNIRLFEHSKEGAQAERAKRVDP